MSITLRFRVIVDGNLTDVTSAVLSDPTGTYGVKRDDTGAIVVADGTAMTHVGTGIYEYTFTEPAEGLDYTYYVEWVYGGETNHSLFTYSDTTTVVSLTEVKAHLRIDSSDEDDLLARLIEAAVNWAELYQRRKYITTSCSDVLDSWPKVIRPRWSPLVSVASITYVDTGGSEQTWSSDQYDVDVAEEPGRIQPAYACSYPSIRQQMNAITINYSAGYGSSASAVPQEIRNGILMLVGHWYLTREDLGEVPAGSTVPLGVRDVLGMDRVLML